MATITADYTKDLLMVLKKTVSGVTTYDAAAGYILGYYKKDKDVTLRNAMGNIATGKIPLPDSDKVYKMTINYALDATADGLYLQIGLLKYFMDLGTAKEKYNRSTDLIVKKEITAKGNGISGSIVLTERAEIYNAMFYGVSIAVVGSPGTDGNGYIRKLEAEIITLTPDIALTHETGSAMIGSAYNIGWTYSQSQNSAQNGVECDVENGGEWKNNFAYDSTFSAISGMRAASMDKSKYPAISSPSEDINVRLRAKSAAGYWSDYAKMVLTLKFPACDALSPNGGEIKLENDVIPLSWHVSAVDGLAIGVYPTKFDIDYSTNGGESWVSIIKQTAVNGSGGDYTYNVPEGLLPEGIIRWRVRAYAAYSLSGEYTIDYYGEETFVCKIQAGTSTVTCDGKPQPTIGWTSSAQVAYQVRFADYDSGAVYSAAKTHKIPKIYAGGLYPVQVRTQASNGKWSEWTDVKYVQITNSAQSDAVTLTAAVTTHAVALSWVDAGTSAKYIVYRDGMAVYAGTDKTYTDVGANGETKYFVRAVKTTGYYAQSATVVVDATPQNDCMYDADNAAWIPLRYSLSRRVRDYSRSGQVVYKHYAGRTKPIAYNSGYVTRQMSAEYAFKTRDEALRLNNTVGRVMIYKDTRGGVLIGVVDDVRIAVYARIYSAQLTITEVDYNEEVTI